MGRAACAEEAADIVSSTPVAVRERAESRALGNVGSTVPPKKAV